jgi:pimeloyl-ACP methyl ester carboxylesterase
MDDAEPLKDLYPDNDFAALPRRAWLAHLVLDYLETQPEVDMKRVAMFGYSRDGKMATIATAFDERIAALVAGSTGVGGVVPWRLSGERGGGESIETTTRMFPTWLAPQVRFFSGREDRLPVDANLFLALLAPRPVLIEWGLNDEVSNGWAIEQAVHSAQKVYARLGRPDGLGLLHVPGFHGGNDPEACIDWLDIQFGRSARTWTNDFVFPWNFEQWRERTGETIAGAPFPETDAARPTASRAEWEQRAPELRRAVTWMLGETPPLMPTAARPASRRPARPAPPGPTVVAQGHVGNPGQLAPDVPAWVISRGGLEFGWLEPEKDHVASRKLRFGFNVTGDLYYPADTPGGTRLPTVIWLHGFNYPLGYMWVYRRDLHPILALVKAGYAVLAYDQVGFGSRWSEAAPFYDRYPHWSQLGRMVEDVRGAVDALQADNLVDPKNISVFGYTLGGTVGLYAAALDARISGVVSICGFTPLRTDTPDRGTGGVARYSHERGLLPRLGLFAGREATLPYDYDDLIGLIAPRPVLVVQPQMDRDAHPADVRAAVERARGVYSFYGTPDQLGLDEPRDIARLPAKTQDRAIAWMKAKFQPRQ